MAESVRIYIPYPLPDPLEAKMWREATKPDYDGPPPIAARDFNYLQDLRSVKSALAQLDLDFPERREPVTRGEERFFALTVKLARGVTAEAIRNALPGFEVEG